MTKIKATNITWHEGHVTRQEREALLQQKGVTVWFTGLSACGKSTFAFTLEHALVQRGHLAYCLDGDNIRHGLNKNLGFSAEDRDENIRRIGEVAKLFADTGVVTMTSFISPYRKDRDRARQLHKDAGLPFVEIFVDTPRRVKRYTSIARQNYRYIVPSGDERRGQRADYIGQSATLGERYGLGGNHQDLGHEQSVMLYLKS